jgi:hypothetical protein
MDHAPRYVWVFVALVAMLGCTASQEPVAPLNQLGGKRLSASLDWGPDYSGGEPTSKATITLELTFDEVGLWLGGACPIVHAAASLDGVVLPQVTAGGALECLVNDDPACGQQCVPARWYGDVKSLVEALPLLTKIAITDASENLNAAVQNLAPMALVDLMDGDQVDLVEGAQVRYGDTIMVGLTPSGDFSLAAVERGLGADLIHQGTYSWGLPVTKVADGLWSLQLLPKDVTLPTAGAATIIVYSGTSNLSFSGCPSDLVCSGRSAVGYRDFPVEYSP